VRQPQCETNNAHDSETCETRIRFRYRFLGVVPGRAADRQAFPDVPDGVSR
jgi:hypothetical protein